MANPLLATKLHIPQISDRHVARKELVRKLSKGFDKPGHLTLVCAPPGYGKTTLVIKAIEDLKHSAAWLSLDDGDNDAGRFLSYIVSALKKAGISIGNDIEFLASDVTFNSLSSVLTSVINCIVSFENKVFLVLDDYHHIKSKQVNDHVKFLIENQPVNLHIIIISREDPQLPLSGLRVKERLTEIRMGDLCFSNVEIGEFFSKAMDIAINSRAVEKIAKRTEGWVAGMQLVGLLLKDLGEDQVESTLNKFSGLNNYIIDYLVEEVLQKQTTEIRAFLCKTSVLDRMNGEICDELTGGKNSRVLLQQMEKSNLFLIPLDLSREWYRYHPLFADSLKTELVLEEEKELYRKASLWMKKKGFIHEAVGYAFKSGDMALATSLVEDSVIEMFQTAQLECLVKWIEQLPEQMIMESEILAVRKSIALFIIGRVNEALTHMESLEDEFIKSASSHNKGLILSLKALIAENTGADAESLAREALTLLGPWDPIARTSMLNTLGKAQYFKGKTAEAIETYKSAFTSGFKMGYTFVTTLSLLNYGICLNALGQRHEALRKYNEYIDGMKQKFGKPLPFIGIIYTALAELYYECNDMRRAKVYIEEGMALCGSISYSWLPSGITVANIKYDSGEREAAYEILDKLANGSQRAGIQAAGVITQQLLRAGRLSDAEKYAKRLEEHLDDPGKYGWQDAALSYARFLVNRSDAGNAFELLQRIESGAIAGQKQKNLITARILQAELCFIQGERDLAAENIKGAVRLGISGGYVRLFLDEEPLIWDVLTLPGITWESSEAGFVRTLLEYGNNSGSNIKGNPSEAVLRDTAALEFGEKLSAREMEILRLIGAGMSNSDISKALYISTNTAQWHISHIYEKLGVKSRTQAVLKGKELGLL